MRRETGADRVLVAFLRRSLLLAGDQRTPTSAGNKTGEIRRTLWPAAAGEPPSRIPIRNRKLRCSLLLERSALIENRRAEHDHDENDRKQA